jgi:V/A-type H+/Na+-transporting ATPase subunit I
MQRHEHALTLPARMARVAVVAPAAHLREALVALADAGTVELAGTPPSASGEALEALRRLERLDGDETPPPVVARDRPDIAELERIGAAQVLAGEVELTRRSATAVEHGSFAALVGWTPEDEFLHLSARLDSFGAAAVALPPPSWPEPPTLIARRPAATPFRPLVETYGPAPYADLDPTLFAAFAFVLMFGMMFGDVGHGLLLAALTLTLRFVPRVRLVSLRRIWPLPFAAGLSAALFGLAYGECFGPTGLVPRLWLDPVDDPGPLLAVALAVGTVLLAQSYVFGTVNRWREQGAQAAILAPTGIAGTCVFLGGGLAAAGWYLDARPLGIAGALTAAAGLALLATGFALEAGRGAVAVLQVAVETGDAIIRIATSAISFTRLGAFGLAHAALTAMVWQAAAAVWGGVTGTALAAVVFLAGNVVAFSLELLVAAIQTLRLEYYELFSRVFVRQGRAFSPWHIPLAEKEES